MPPDISTQPPTDRSAWFTIRAAICSVALALAALAPVDGVTCSARSQVGGSGSWMPLANLYATVTLARGMYQVTARICSATGVCGTVSIVVKARHPETARLAQ
jgi:hypothetical protein